LPVYALLLGFVFYREPPWKAGLALAGLYLLSLLLGALASVVANRFLPVRESSFFILELPPYRKPQLRKVLRSTWERTQSYLRKAAPVIFAFSLLIWVATTFPHYEAVQKGERLQQSWAAQAGHVLEPVMSPMGADWRVGVGLLSAFAAREVFVSSMAIVFNATAQDEDEERSTLITQMQTARKSDGSPLFTTASVTALILFFMIALQCMSTVTVSLKESGQWRFAALQLVLFNLVAYALAVAIYQTMAAL
jgi:ferrous iron transport protein B